MRTSERRRRGMTLIEIMVSLVLLGIVSRRDHARDHAPAAVLSGRQPDHGAARPAAAGDGGRCPIDLRSLSSVGNDILVATDSSIEFMVNVGTGVVCERRQRRAGRDAAATSWPADRASRAGTATASRTRRTSRSPPTPSTSTTTAVSLGNEEDAWQKFTLSDVQHERQRGA